MHEDNRKNILEGNLDVSMLSTISSKINVGVIGGGKASLIKSKTLLKSGCKIQVLSKNFNEEFKELEGVTFIQGNYYSEFIKDKHLIIIGVDDEEIIKEIVDDCNKEYKLFINCANPIMGNTTLPAQRRGKNFTVGVSIKNGNPKGSVFGVNIAKESLNPYDDYFCLTSKLRNKGKLLKNEKSDLLTFIGDEDFLYFFQKEKEKLVLRLFYNEELIENLYKD